MGVEVTLITSVLVINWFVKKKMPPPPFNSVRFIFIYTASVTI